MAAGLVLGAGLEPGKDAVAVGQGVIAALLHADVVAAEVGAVAAEGGGMFFISGHQITSEKRISPIPIFVNIGVDDTLW